MFLVLYVAFHPECLCELFWLVATAPFRYAWFFLTRMLGGIPNDSFVSQASTVPPGGSFLYHDTFFDKFVGFVVGGVSCLAWNGHGLAGWVGADW